MIRHLTVLAVATFGIAAAQAQNVYYEGRTLNYSSEDRPYNSRGSLMVPARRTAEMIGASLDRDNSGRRLGFNWRGNRVLYYQGDRFFDFNGRRMTLSNSSEVRRDVLFVPYEMFRDLTDGRFSMNAGQGWGRGGDIGRWDDRYGGGGRYDQGGGRYDDRNYSRDTLTWNGRPLTFDYKTHPYTRGGVLMVPFRELGEKIGARTDRTADGLRVWIYYNNDRVEYNKGHSWFRINSTRRELRTTSEDRNGVLFVPVTLFEEITRGRLRAGY